ncbi:hypothetical protein [Fodinibius salsisoli]|uniref:RNA polymerase sigma factor, sigma-70 family n=1 Tax=Fodinibius salsisoli TaxID=2820877 RepID=A0ABT3PM13_9BACT|nr:hypothetical protein [Fodinibius salsisoli]MCW9706209.1 hypothetical protein [Fodinibius salsisoli]
MTNNAQDRFEELTEDELQELYEKLLSFANFRLDFNDTTQGLSAEDFVHRVIRKVIDTDSQDHRRWNTETTPNFENFLKSCLSSEISNHFNRKNTKTTSTIETPDQDDSFFDLQDSGTALMSEIEGNELREHLFDELIEYDEELTELLFLQEKEYTTDEIVEELNYESRQKVYNARKRLRRACETFLDQLSGSYHE